MANTNNAITPGTQRQSRAEMYKRAAKEMKLDIYKPDGTVDREVLKTIREAIGPPDAPKSNIPQGAKNQFGGRFDMTA